MKCSDCDYDAVAFYTTPLGCGYSCEYCLDHDPETEIEYLT